MEIVNRKKFHVNTAIHSKNIPFLWQELDCRTRPIAIAFSAFNEDFLDLFLLWESYSKFYLIDQMGNILDDTFVDFYTKTLKDIFGVSFKIEYVQPNGDLNEEIMKNIDDEKIVVLPVDLYLLPYAADYKINHHQHYIILKGYDSERDLYYVLDNMQLESGATRYENFKMLYSEVDKLNSCYCDHFIGDGKKYFYVLHKYKESKKSGSSTLRLLKEYISRSTSKSKIICPEKICYHSLSHMNEEILRSSLNLMNKRTVYVRALCSVLKKAGADSTVLAQFQKEMQSVMEKWLFIKNKLLYLAERKKETLAGFEQVIDTALTDEFLCVSKILDQIDFSCMQEGRVPRLFFKNFESSEYELESGLLHVIHSRKKRYDTWLVQDDACQLLFLTADHQSITCCVNVVNSSSTLVPFHMGLIIKLDDHSNILFGNESNTYLSIYHPISPQSFSLFKKESLNKNIFIKIILNGNIFNFYWKEQKHSQWEFIYTYQAAAKAGYIGLFSKTWDFVDHTATFQNFELEMDDSIITMDDVYKIKQGVKHE